MAKPVILVVDDEPVVRDIVHVILTPAGYHVLSADDGAAALQLSRSYTRPIDLLLTDVKMPKMRGPDLAEVIVKERPGIRILLMSGHPSGEIPQHLRSKLLRKPFLPEELLRRIEQTFSSAPDSSL